MKDLDFIRYLIDLVDKHSTEHSPEPEESPEHGLSSAVISVVDSDIGDSDTETGEVDPTTVPSAFDKDDIYIPPLQQRIEMLKKLTGVTPHDREILSHADGDDPTDA